MIEVIAASGYDFVVIDTEHVAINDETLAHLIRAAEQRILYQLYVSLQ